MGRPKGSKNKVRNFLDAVNREMEKPKKQKESKPAVNKAPPILIKVKRSTAMMLEVLPWVRRAKYNELMAVAESAVVITDNLGTN